MNSSSRFASDGISGFQVLWENGERVFCRGNSHGDDTTLVLAVLPATEHPAPAVLDRLAHEYELRDELDVVWAARPLEFVRERGQTILLLQDPGGEPLDRLIGPPMEVELFLRLAVAFSAALGRLHGRGLVHKDIKPTNVLVNVSTGQVWLTGFGIASRLPRVRQSPDPPELLEGTLAYMAPEQTGRMNRSIDSRSDLYSLGVTLYQMLTGTLPFTASDPMEWVHCHIAKNPVPPSELLNSVPAPVSTIIMKLLAKAPEDRYQTAAGLEHDLRRCMSNAQARVDPFPLGERDLSDRLMIPEKLYGRTREIETLLDSFDRIVDSGAPELTLVSGYSGIGKSSVVNELHKVLVPPRGLFASGKFDQYKRDIPYSTLAQAFQNLIRPLLGRSDPQLAEWREAFREALGPNATLIIDLVPELKLVIGEQPPVPDLPPQDAQARFHLVFRRFLAVFARPEHPLALFLDDLQWLDSATLDLLEDLLIQPDVRHVMLIGSYRDNEVDSDHPLMRKLEAIRKAGAVVHEIALSPLAREDLERLIEDLIHCEATATLPLAQLVQEKTAGNPFFVVQFLYDLAEEGLLFFDRDSARWSWDLNGIRTKGYTENVVDLMVAKLDRLPLKTRQAVQLLACIGNSAEPALLELASEESSDELHDQLWDAIRGGLILRTEQSYRFIHDRVHEAAYSLITEKVRAETHLRIGRLLVAHTPPEKQEERVFDIVNQLNRGAHLFTSAEERKHLAELNLIAGRRAKSSTAYVSALSYLGVARALLTEESWKDEYELMFSIEHNAAECELLTADTIAARDRLLMLAQRAKNAHDVALVSRLRVILYTALDQSDRSVEVCLKYLQSVGIDWPAHPTRDQVMGEYDRVWTQLGSREIGELIDLPSMTNSGILDALDLMSEVVVPAHYCDENLPPLIICRMVNLSLEHGNSDASCFAYLGLAMINGPVFGNYSNTGSQFGRLGHDLAEKRGLKRLRARMDVAFGNIILPWTRHVCAGRNLIQRAFDAANELGDLAWAAYSRNHLISNLLASGDQLAEVQREAESGLAFARNARLGLVIDIITAQLALIRTLRGLTLRFGCFDDGPLTELGMEEHLSGNPALAIASCWYWVRKMQARYLAGELTAALDAAAKAQQLLWTSPSHLETIEFCFYSALSHAGSWDSAPTDEKERHSKAVRARHKLLETWAKNCPENFESRAALVGAEMARIESRDLDAMRLYEQAIRSAHENRIIHNEALAYELAARFYAARGFEQIAHLYLRNARYGYIHWGAAGKVRQLDHLYPDLKREESVPGSTSTIEAPVERLDLATVTKVSQAVSSEIVLESLIDTLMRTAIAQAGAERALLILPRGQESRIAAEATTSGDKLTVHLRDEAVAEDVLPESVLHYVLRTGESVILDDASAKSPFGEDSYISRHQARSILCLPLLNQAKLIGVLYLENNLTPRVFAPARISVLKLLASQAAIALENARLYRDVAEREAKIRRLVDANVIGIFIWEFEKRIIEANDAFLRMVGYDRDDLVAGRLSLAGLRSSGWRDHKDELKRTGAVQPFENEYCRKDGGRVPVLVGAATLEEGGNQGVAFVLDLTERKRAEEALRESEAKFRDYAETASDWLWETGPDQKFTMLTANAFGSDPADRIGTTCWDRALDVETEPEKWRRVWATMESHKPFRDFVFCTVGGSGAPMYVKTSGKPTLDSCGKFRGYRGTCTDVTAIVRGQRAEASLRTAQAELAHVGRVMTLGQLTASIAHEINQPIGSARNNARAALNFLDRSPPDLGEVREALGCIVGDADRAGGIIDRVRDQIKKAPPRYDYFDLNQAIEEVIGLAQSMITEHGVSVQTRLASGMAPVQGDRVQLQQVVLNLILNAVEAMSSVEVDERELLISTEQCQANGTLVAVRDSGPGIDPKRLELVFDAFYTTKSGGMGMGLSICRSIIDAHGGRLWAAANEPRGVLFQFTLPERANEVINRQAVRETGEPHEDIASDASHPPAFEGSQ